RVDLVDELHVETLAAQQLVPPVAIQDDAGQLVSRLVDGSAADAIQVRSQSMGRKDRQSLLLGRHEDDHQIGRATLLRVGNGGLVAMVAVRNQELRALEARGIVGAPELVAAALEIGSAGGRRKRFTLVEEEARL